MRIIDLSSDVCSSDLVFVYTRLNITEHGWHRSAKSGSSVFLNAYPLNFSAPSLISSTTAGSSSVVISPTLDVSPSAILRRIRRMILPDRGFGRPLTNWILSGLAQEPLIGVTVWLILVGVMSFHHG